MDVPIDFLSVQNEPQNRKPSAYPGTDMPVRQEAAVISALGPCIARPARARRSSATAQIFRGTLTWHARTLMLGTTRNWAKSVVNWNIALDSTGGPHLGGCDTCTGLITLQPDGTVTTDAEYYTIGHLSKFVKPGAVRIGSTSYGTTGWNGQLMSAAFRNPDGSTALVVHNENDDPRSFAVALGDKSFEYELPGGSIATFTWGPTATDAPQPVSLDGAKATASVNGAEAGLAIDADGSTVWQSKQAQAPGQSVQVDLGRAQTFRRIALDSGGNLGDYARGYDVAISNDGTHWRTVGSGTASGQLTTVDVRPVHGRYLRVTSTGTAASWWSLADLRLYR